VTYIDPKKEQISKKSEARKNIECNNLHQHQTSDLPLFLRVASCPLGHPFL